MPREPQVPAPQSDVEDSEIEMSLLRSQYQLNFFLTSLKTPHIKWITLLQLHLLLHLIMCYNYN